MFFTLLKYLQPTHYFALKKLEGTYVFPIVDELPKSILDQLFKDESYKSNVAKEYDLSWQAIQKGYVGNTKTYNTFEKLPIIDEYRFVKKYFNKVWSLYVLLLRIISFKNPFIEISAWHQSRNVKRSNFLKTPINHSNWEAYASNLVQKTPLVSVIIPTLNRYKYLKDVLLDLEQQDYSNFEVIIVDQSEPFQESFYKSFKLDLHVIYQEEKALWLARNRAVRKAKGDFLLLFDDDSRVDKDWITNHVKCLDFFKAEVSSGVSISIIGAKVPENYSFFRVSDQIDTGNVLIKKEVFKAIGMFDRQFEKQRMGDGEFGLRSFLHGFLNISNPFAQRLHLKVGTGGLRQMGSWDGFRPKNWFGPRPIPSVVYLFIKYFGTKRTRLTLLKTVPPSIIPYRFKKSKMLMLVGTLISLIISPIILFQVLKSWNLANKKLKQGDLIEPLG
jgi:glycosyltransferase involved in cell wall biosynthesis